jgi:hypothetical protein
VTVLPAAIRKPPCHQPRRSPRRRAGHARRPAWCRRVASSGRGRRPPGCRPSGARSAP